MVPPRRRIRGSWEAASAPPCSLDGRGSQDGAPRALCSGRLRGGARLAQPPLDWLVALAGVNVRTMAKVRDARSALGVAEPLRRKAGRSSSHAARAGTKLSEFLREAVPLAGTGGSTTKTLTVDGDTSGITIVVAGGRHALVGRLDVAGELALGALGLRLAALESLIREMAPHGRTEPKAKHHKLLSDVGFDVTGRPPRDPEIIGALELALLLDASLSVEEAARLLGVNGSRVRQRLLATPPSLYGIKDGGCWRLPRFQFVGKATLPGFADVLARLDPTLGPIAFARWLVAPNADLVADEESDEPVSPLDWLRHAHAPASVAALAADL